MYESKRRVNILRITRQTLTKYVIRKFIDLKQYKKNPPNPLVFCEDAIKGDLEMNCPNFYYFFSFNKGEARRGILPILPKIKGYWHKFFILQHL